MNTLPFWTCITHDRQTQTYFTFGVVLAILFFFFPFIGLFLIFLAYQRYKKIQNTFTNGVEVTGTVVGVPLLVGLNTQYQYEFQGQSYTQSARYYYTFSLTKDFPLGFHTGDQLHVYVDPANPGDGIAKELFFGRE